MSCPPLSDAAALEVNQFQQCKYIHEVRADPLNKIEADIV